MITLDALFALVSFAFVSSITPGPNNLMLMASGTNFGITRTIPHMMGVSIGFVAMMILIGFGLIGLFHAYPFAYEVLKWLSVAYLLYLAWKIATAAPPAAKGVSTTTEGAKPMTFWQAVLFQWVNPKAWTMALTGITVYAPTQHPLLGLVLVSVVFGIVNLPSVGLWTVMGAQLRQVLDNQRNLRIFNVTMAIILVATLYPVVFGGATHHPSTVSATARN